LGTKRHVLVVDQKGVPLSVTIITGANIHDMKASINTLDKIVVHKPVEKHNLCLDKGYDFPEIERESSIKRRYVPHIRHRGVEKEFIKLRYYSARRWVIIERTNSWHNRFRKLLLVRYEKKSENYLALVCLACCIIVVYRRIILG
jgi:transposase